MGKKKQSRTLTSPDNQTKRDEKAKKTYALSKSETVPSHSGAAESLQKVFIPERLEHDIIDLILKSRQQGEPVGGLSKRLTVKKLTDLYNSLSDAGFSPKQIESAMTNSVSHGGDLVDALDWLCLNIKNDELPEGFSETLLREEKKKRPQFDSLLQVPSVKVCTDGGTQTVKKQASNPSTSSMKDWILKYSEQECSEEQAQDDQEFDPNDRYLMLTAKLLDAKNQASLAKQQGNKSQQKELSKTIREVMKEMDTLEKHPGFNPAVKIKGIDADKSEARVMVKHAEDTALATTVIPTSTEEDKFDLSGFGMMEEKAVTETRNQKSEVQEKEDVRNFEYTRQQWTGKSPKQFLIDWVRKHLPHSNPPKFEKIQCRQRWKCKAHVDRKKDGGMLDVCPEILCENVREAEHLASTLALYHLCKGQPVHQLLPPPYRTVWLEWLDAENSAKQDVKEKENKPRDQFVSRLLKKLQLEERKSSCKPSPMTPEYESGEEEGTWEDLADQDDWGPKAASEPSGPKHHISHKLDTGCLVKILQNRQKLPEYQKFLKTRQSLPVFQHRQEIMDKIQNENVVIIAGETGSGKSTQVPQFVLEDMLMSGQGSNCNIVCTQPRRVSAISLANRVSQELGEKTPGKRDSLCGYQIRFESRRGPNTKLLYCTTGVLLRRLQMNPDLNEVTHIIIDEVHERSVQSDFLLIVVREILKKRSQLKVILMSATLDSEKFSAYFQYSSVINIPGRMYPVEVLHLEDVIEMTGYVIDEDSQYTIKSNHLVQEESTTVEVTERGRETSQVQVYWTKENISKIDKTDLSPERYCLRTRNAVTRLNPNRINMDLIMELLHHLDIDPQWSQIDGAVLIFLPGLSDIQELFENLQADRKFSDTNRYLIMALHSVLSSEDQTSAFSIPPLGVRKIVLATNIAETGITIPDVAFVIDSGKAKENRYIESSQMSSLEEVFVSKTNAKQRQGRAGRVRRGFCFRLFTKQMYEGFHPYTIPELLRVPLEELCLNIMKCKFGKPVEFLAKALDPPQSTVVFRALSLLQEVGACENDGYTLMPLGHHLAALPVHVRIGKMLLFAAMFGCLEPVAVIAATMTDKSPFVVPVGKKDVANTAKQAQAVACSDHLTLYKAYSGWQMSRSQGRQAEQRYCSQNFLKRNTLLDIENVKEDLIKVVKSIGFHTTTKKSFRSSNKSDILDISNTSSAGQGLDLEMIAMVKAVLVAGLYPCVAKISFTPAVDAAANPEKLICLAETAQGIAQIHPSSVNRFLQANGWLVYHEKVRVSRVYLRDSSLISSYPLLLFGGDIDVQHTQQLVMVDGWIKFKTKARTGVIFKEIRYLLGKLLQRKLEEPSLDISDNELVDLTRRLLQAEKT